MININTYPASKIPVTRGLVRQMNHMLNITVGTSSLSTFSQKPSSMLCPARAPFSISCTSFPVPVFRYAA